MKRLFALLLATAMLTGCAGTERPAPNPSQGAPKMELPESEPAGEMETVSYELNFINMSLELPENWGYAYVGAGVDGGGVHAEPADTVGIRFWPDKAEDMGGGALALYYYADLFAVCGTGLQTRDITLDSGLTGSMGTYDNGAVWDFIRLYDTPGSYVVINEGADGWWDEYGGQAMAILDSIRVGGDILRQSQAEALAMSACTIDYNAMRATFDADSGEWEILFYLMDTAGGDQTVWVSPDGKTRSESGE